MPQVDLETLVTACAGGGGSMDRKIACETLADGGEVPPEMEVEPELPPDFPPESFWLSKDAEFDWFDRNAFFERKESQKGNSSNSTNLNPNIIPGSNSNSQRFSKNHKSKAAIIGLPKNQKNIIVDSKNRKNCRGVNNARLFPKRSGSAAQGRSDGQMIEPSSPKVSCMGRVRSKRDRKRRCKKTKPISRPEPASEVVKPVEHRKTGFFASFRAIFRTGCKEKPAQASSRYEPVTAGSEWSEESPPPSARSAARTMAREFDAQSLDSLPRRSMEIEPPGLGGLQRFSSGRRSASLVDAVA